MTQLADIKSDALRAEIARKLAGKPLTAAGPFVSLAGDRDAKQMADAFRPPKSKESRMSKTERRYRAEVLDRRDDIARVVYEGITIRMGNGHKYTADFALFLKNGRVELVEVKGAYRLGSYQRARLAFDQSRVEFPEFLWTWAEQDGRGWK